MERIVHLTKSSINFCKNCVLLRRFYILIFNTFYPVFQADSKHIFDYILPWKVRILPIFFYFFIKLLKSDCYYRLQDWVNSKKVLTSWLLWIYESWMNIFIIRCFRKNNNWKICCPIGGANLLITDRQGNRDVNTLE